MKITKPQIRHSDPKIAKGLNTNVPGEGITKRLLEKYKPHTALLSIDAIKGTQVQDRAA